MLEVSVEIGIIHANVRSGDARNTMTSIAKLGEIRSPERRRSKVPTHIVPTVVTIRARAQIA